MTHLSWPTIPDVAGRDCDGGTLPREARCAEPDAHLPDVRVPGDAPGRRLRGLRLTDPSDRGALAEAYRLATRSPDPSTQNGAVVALNGRALSGGWNHFPVGTPEEWGSTWDDKPLKYDLVVHAEVAATLGAPGAGAMGATLAVVWYACTDCAKVIIESGIRRVVGHQDVRTFAEQHSPGWNASIARALKMLDRAGIECIWLDGPVDAPSIRVGGQTFDPCS